MIQGAVQATLTEVCRARFPERADTLLETLMPFHNWELRLTPAVADLPERIKRALPWEDVQDVVVYTADQAEEILFSGCGTLLDDFIQAELETFRSVHDHEAIDAIILFLSRFRSDEFIDAYKHIEHRVIALMVVRSLALILLLFVGYCLNGHVQNALRYKPLLDLYLRGNCPLGHDWEGRVVVLVSGRFSL